MKLGPKQEQWLEDLPKYEKVTRRLGRVGEGFCCLGVYAHTQVEEPWIVADDGVMHYRYDEIHYAILAPKDAEALGLRSPSGVFKFLIKVGHRDYESLAHLNDRGPFKDHAEMAEFIRDHAEDIFTRAV
jgi:hypothetical protein